jgi:hypothetical protein
VLQVAANDYRQPSTPTVFSITADLVNTNSTC